MEDKRTLFRFYSEVDLKRVIDESFCSVRLTLSDQQVDFGWDISLRATPRRGGQVVTKWLREEIDNEKWARVDIDGKKTGSSLRYSIKPAEWRIENNRGKFEGGGKETNLEDMSLEVVDGKKRQRYNIEKERSDNRKEGWSMNKTNTLRRLSGLGDRLSKWAKKEKGEEIHSLFGEEQMQKIVSIPLASNEPEDVLVWREDKSGIYTAKTSYRRLNTTGDCRIQHNLLTKFYTKLWNLKVPMCQAEEETVSHLFRDCNFTRQVLRDLGDIKATCNRETNWKTWLGTDFEHLTDEESNTVAHGMAMEGWKYKDPQYWVEGVPRMVEELVNIDRNHCNDRRNVSDESGSNNDESIR
ncbi:hypothetical protein GOBAR_AA40292 [Gossypium barbadense]|uniref:Reverse transcriptase zinc-binding domain-containing protein n=1 Tax=Gossypium barbadense TaxID=3634 RepID=A0A2P5VNK5_GOSBA|nr:hypothetical protein GOBAR_AA40292 [Gossypium barbadense]